MPICASKAALKLGLRPHWWRVVLSSYGWSWGQSSPRISWRRSELPEPHLGVGTQGLDGWVLVCFPAGDKGFQMRTGPPGRARAESRGPQSGYGPISTPLLASFVTILGSCLCLIHLISGYNLSHENLMVLYMRLLESPPSPGNTLIGPSPTNVSARASEQGWAGCIPHSAGDTSHDVNSVPESCEVHNPHNHTQQP